MRRPPLTEKTNGSVLVPVVAAMLMLLLTGIALVELAGAQTMQSVHSVESTRAYWIAEAGLWHAAHDEMAIPTPVSFGGGSYTVIQSAATYTSTGIQSLATRPVQQTFSASGGGAGGGSGTPNPLNEMASEATAVWDKADRFEINLVSGVAYSLQVASFSLSADRAMPKLKEFKLGGDKIWKVDAGVDLPTGTLTLNKGNTGDRTISGGAGPVARLKFTADPTPGPVTYTLGVNFTDGTSSTLTFTINW